MSARARAGVEQVADHYGAEWAAERGWGRCFFPSDKRGAEALPGLLPW